MQMVDTGCFTADRPLWNVASANSGNLTLHGGLNKIDPNWVKLRFMFL